MTRQPTLPAPTPPPANDNPDDGGFAFAIGETIDVMTTAVIVERSQSATGRTYLVLAKKEDGREIYIRAAEHNIYECEPADRADGAERVAA